MHKFFAKIEITSRRLPVPGTFVLRQGLSSFQYPTAVVGSFMLCVANDSFCGSHYPNYSIHQI